MARDAREALAGYVNDPPADLLALFASPPPSAPELGINLLKLEDAIKYTQALHDRTLLGKPMGLVALDDANDSNPYCYVTRGPAAGCILHLEHDGDVAVEYPSLAAFLTALNRAVAEGLWVDDLPGKDRRPAVDQDAVCKRLFELSSSDTDEAECELIVLSRLLDTAKVDAVRQLVGHASFLVREAAAELLSQHPEPRLADEAEALAKDGHPQVARPGKVALSAVKRIATGS